MRMKHAGPSGRRRQPGGRVRAAGFSLLEVLMALIVTSIGILGLASMQLLALKQNYNAQVRAEVVQISHAIIESMRANRAAALAGEYDIGYADPSPAAGVSMAARDLVYWRQRIGAALPAGEGAIDVDAVAGTATISLRWDDARGLGGAENPTPGDLLEFQVVTEL